MQLAAPEYLWPLAVLLPLMWWLSRPPRPRQQVATAHLEQWRLALRALRRRPPRGSPWRFALLACATVAAALAAAGPSLPGAPGPDRLVVLLDASLSMAARDVDGRARFDEATDAVRRELAAVPAHVDVTALRCGGDLVRRYGDAARALTDIGAPAGPLDVDLVALAAEVTRDDGAVVWTLTDGQGQAALPPVGPRAARTVLGAPADNAAVLDVRVDDAWPLPTLHVEVDVVAFAKPTAAGPLCAASVSARGGLVADATRSLSLAAGERTTVAFDLQRAAAGGELELRIELAPGRDRLPADDARRLRLPPLPAPRIAVLAEGDAGPFAEVAAGALAEEVAGEVLSAADATAGAEAGLLLVDGGVVPVEPGRVRALTFGTRLADEVAAEPWQAPGPLDWSRTAELTRGLDLSELRVDRAWRGVLPAGDAFLWADDGGERVPLGVVVTGERTASVHLAFRLQDGNLPLLAAFPQLLRRAFVASYGAAAAIGTADAVDPAPAGELDLRGPARGPDGPLPAFAGAPTPLGRWFVLGALFALAARAFVR